MKVAIRFSAASALTALALLGATPRASAQARVINGQAFVPGQPIFAPSVANQQVNPGYYIAPGLTIAQAAFNTRVAGSAIRSIPPYAFGYNPYPQSVNFGPNFPIINPYLSGTNLGGYGGLGTAALATGAYGGGYGASLATSPYGGYGGGYGASLDSGLGSPYGYGGYGGYYPDPYTGYLMGVADVTNAQGRYLSQVQQARLLQTQADSAKLDLRRRIAEEAAIERKNWLNPEAERVKGMQAAYERATREPPVTEVLSGQALNDLYNHVYPLQAKGVKVTSIPLDEDMLKQINLTGAGSGGSIALLKDRGRLNWPLALQSPEFDGPRKEITALAADAVNQARLNNPVGAATLRDMMNDVHRMSEALLHNVGEIPPSEYVEAKRYLNQLDSAVRALQDPNVGNQLNQNWAPRARSVSELVDFMGQKGLRFAPATAGDEPAYRHLYQRMLAYDSAMSSQANVATTTPK